MRNNQNGFSLLEIVVGIVLIVLIIVVVWYVYNGHKGQDYTSASIQSVCGTLQIEGENGNQYFLPNKDFNTFKTCFYNPYTKGQKTSVAFHMQGIDASTDIALIYHGSSLFNGSKITQIYGGGSADVDGTATSASTISCSNMTSEKIGYVIKCKQNGDLLFSSENTPEVVNNF